MLYDINIDGKSYRLELNRAEERWTCRLDGREVDVDAILVRPDVLSIRIGNLAYEAMLERVADELHVWVGSSRFAAEIRDPRSLRGRSRAGDDHGPKKIVAPMPGKVVRILVKAGDEVAAGAGIAVVEAMKMQNEMKSPKAGIVVELKTSDGATVAAGEILVVIE